MNASLLTQLQTKKALILFSLFIVLGSVKAQSTFNIIPVNTITSTVDCDSAKDLYFFIENPNSKAVEIEWRVKSNTLPSTFDGEDGCWMYQLCDWELCTLKIPDVNEVISRSPIQPKTIHNEMKLTVMPGQIKGGGTLVIELFEKNFPSNAKSITWNVTGCSTGKECTSGITENAVNAEFMVYPNPAQEFVNVELKSSYTKNSSIQFYNMMGEKLAEWNDLKSNTQRIDLTKLPAGGYFIKFNSGNGASAKKIFKTQ